MPGTVTLASRQRRMQDFMNPNLAYRFLAIGRTSPWNDENNPPIPSEKMTEIEELIGLQRIDSYKYAKAIPNPTTLQKKTGVYYKGVYYQVTQDSSIALSEGYTSVLCSITLDRDTVEAIPVDVTFRQVGLYVGVKATPDEIKYGITRAEWDNKIAADKGTLEVVDNRAPLRKNGGPTRTDSDYVGFLISIFK